MTRLANSVRDQLLAAILLAPDDDTTRLVYADSLEEAPESRQDVYRADFVRLQIRHAARYPEPLAIYRAYSERPLVSEDTDGYTLRRVAAKLLERWRREWSGVPAESWRHAEGFGGWFTPGHPEHGPVEIAIAAHWRRGWIDHLEVFAYHEQVAGSVMSGIMSLLYRHPVRTINCRDAAWRTHVYGPGDHLTAVATRTF